MKIARWLCLFFVTSVAAVSFAGDIQVSCSPGLRVYLDDEFMGTSSAKEDGLFLMNVPHGTRVIRVEKDGFVPQSIQIEVSVRGNLFEGKIETLYQGKGSLRVKSTPLRCTVRVAGMIREKTHPKLNLTHIPAGEYSIVFSIPGRELSENILILNRQRTVVEVDFSNRNEPIVVSYVPF